LDERGNHYKLLLGQLEEIVGHIKGNMEEKDTEEDVDINIKILSNILKNILNNNRKRKTNNSIDYC